MTLKDYQNTIPPTLFRSTNSAWNYLSLNAPWSVGYVSTLIESENFAKKEDWEIFYYKSGKERLKIIQAYTPAQQDFLNNHTLQKTTPAHIKKLSPEIRNINLLYGRTAKELKEKGQILFNYMQKVNSSISLEQCIKAVRFRVIGETWNGIILRERNTIQKLKEMFPKYEFHKTDGDFDHLYAVDYEIFEKGNLVCGIQIKPKSYTFSTPYLKKARLANRRKNVLYKTEFGQAVFDFIAKKDGEILNKEVLKKINR